MSTSTSKNNNEMLACPLIRYGGGSGEVPVQPDAGNIEVGGFDADLSGQIGPEREGVEDDQRIEGKMPVDAETADAGSEFGSRPELYGNCW